MQTMIRQNGSIRRIMQTEGGMTFIVSGFSQAGPASLNCKTPVRALERALELVHAGFANVLTTEGRGVPHTPDMFFRLFLM